jgi:HAD superfamily hydrolase (TIGR01509 family)
MRPYRALIFDLDGVIIDTEPKHKEAKRAAFSRYGLAVPETLYDAFRGRSDEDMARHVVREFGPGDLDWSEVLALKHELFYGLEHGIEPVPGALEFIRAARGRFEKLAVATSATARNQRFAFDRFGLAPYFDAVVNAGDITRAKPHPDAYLAAVAKLGLPAEACLVIEDSKNGIASGKAAGCKVAALTTSFTRGELADADADYIVDGFAELADVLEVPLNPS